MPCALQLPFSLRDWKGFASLPLPSPGVPHRWSKEQQLRPFRVCTPEPQVVSSNPLFLIGQFGLKPLDPGEVGNCAGRGEEENLPLKKKISSRARDLLSLVRKALSPQRLMSCEAQAAMVMSSYTEGGHLSSIKLGGPLSERLVPHPVLVLNQMWFCPVSDVKCPSAPSLS